MRKCINHSSSKYISAGSSKNSVKCVRICINVIFHIYRRPTIASVLNENVLLKRLTRVRPPRHVARLTVSLSSTMVYRLGRSGTFGNKILHQKSGPYGFRAGGKLDRQAHCQCD